MSVTTIPPPTSDIAALIAAVDADRSDVGVKLALADALDEAGLEDAAWGLRWHINRHVWPQSKMPGRRWYWIEDAEFGVTPSIFNALAGPRGHGEIETWLTAMDYFGQKVRPLLEGAKRVPHDR